MSELEILNCPFCGDAPQVLPKVQDYGPRVMCRNHKCRLDASFAVEAWNQRDTSAIESAVLRRVAGEVVGDVLPPIGSVVQIHMASSDEWEDVTVIGFYVWNDLGGNESLRRVFVRVMHEYCDVINARLLKDVRINADRIDKDQC